MELSHAHDEPAYLLTIYIDFLVTSANTPELKRSLDAILVKLPSAPKIIRLDLCMISQSASSFFGFMGDVVDECGVEIELQNADEVSIRTLETLGVQGVRVVS